MATHWLCALLLLWRISIISALPSNLVQTACQRLGVNLANKVHLPGSSQYKDENHNYWNAMLEDLGPTCIVMPESTNDVVNIVKMLNTYNEVPFAIKSGGHSPSVGQSSVKDGILIALRNLNGTTYDPTTQLATVQPGGRWTQATEQLAKYNRTAIGCRLGNIGVGGFLSQGGLSFLSAQHGLGADNIVEWEVVLANGTVANIKASDRPDLAVAMRGGGDQFGIITKFTVRTYKQGDVWVGAKVFTYGQREKVYEALADFLENNHKDPKAAIVFDTAYGTNNVMTAFMLMVYDGPTPPKGAYRQFEDINRPLSLSATVKYTTAIKMTDTIFEYLSPRTGFRSVTIPHQPGNRDFFKTIDDTWNEVANRYIKGRWDALLSVTYQPFPRIIGAASDARGGNAMGLTGNDHDRLVLEFTTLWRKQADDDMMSKMVHEITTALQTKVDSMRRQVNGSSKAIMGEYNPYFMNDAAIDQDVTGSYKNAAKFAQLQKEMDPQGLWSSRAGGFKYKLLSK